ncbi:MAG TPA: hypothetical protein VNA28_03640 [Solirubrobacteraceae bacterium]|nr:hypothetical protein [Solirubrobacteraceae bacterium]
MNRLRLLSVTALAVVATATGSAPAHAAWGPPQVLAAPAAEQLAATGNAEQAELFAWKVTTRRRVRTATQTGFASFVRARMRRANGSLGAARAISSAKELVANPAVALDSAGNATVVWVQSGRTIRIVGAHRRTGGRFGRPFVIGRSTAFSDARPALTVGPDGAIVVVWNGGRRVQVARRTAARCAAGRPRGCFGGAQSFTRGTDHAIAMSRGGSAFVVWAASVGRGGAAGTALRMAIAPRGLRFGFPRAISSAGNVSQPSVAVAPNGDAIVAWRASLPAGGEQNADAPIVSAVRASSGIISASQVVSELPGSGPQVRANDQGEAILVWNQRNPTPENPDGPEVAGSLRPAGASAFEAPFLFSPAGAAAGSASLAIDDDGTAVAGYTASLTGGYRPPPAAFTRSMTSGRATFATPESLGEDFSGAFVFSAGSLVTAASAGSGGRTLIRDRIAG